MSEVTKYMALGEMVQRSRKGGGNFVSLADYDALAAQRDEGLAREAELQPQLAKQGEDYCKRVDEVIALQQLLNEKDHRLDEAMRLLRAMTCGYHLALENGYDRIVFLGGECDSVERMENDNPDYGKARAFLATPARPDDACAHSYANKLGCPECGDEFSGDEVKP